MGISIPPATPIVNWLHTRHGRYTRVEDDFGGSVTDKPIETVVVSDLHLGEGRRPHTGAIARMEDFVWDEEWRRFCEYLLAEAERKGRGLRIVLNGDCFDLLQMVRPYDGPLPTKRTERVYGAGSAPGKGAWKLSLILDGHPRFVEGLGAILAAGHEIVVVTGNHDAEFYWPDVQKVLEDRVRTTAAARLGQGEAIGGTIRFEQWFLIVDGELWIEHGHRYDPINSFRFQLEPVLPNTAGYPDDRLLRLPIGSLFARYLFNPLDNRYPLADNMGDDSTAFLWAVRNHPLSTGRLLLAYGTAFLRVLRKQKLFLPREIGPIRARHRQRREALAERYSLQPAALARVDSLQKNPTGGGHFGFMIKTLLHVLRKSLMPLAVITAAAFLLVLMHSSIEAMFNGPLVQSLALTASYLVILFGALITMLLLGSRRAFLRRRRPEPYRQAARDIAERTGVRFVTVGHSHLSDVAEIGGDGLYFNTGTWTSLFHEEYQPLRPMAEFTYVEHLSGQARLMRWDDARGEPAPARVLERPQPGFPLEDLDRAKPE